jgi:hypothetical protein
VVFLLLSISIALHLYAELSCTQLTIWAHPLPAGKLTETQVLRQLT